MHKCSFCTSEFNHIHEYNKHQHSHKHRTEVKIPCMYDQCNVESCSTASFSKHISQGHRDSKDGNFFCKLAECSFPTHQMRDMKSHYHEHAKNSESEGSIVCPHCLPTNTVFTSESHYRVHLSRNHRYVLNSGLDGANIEVDASLVNDAANVIINDQVISHEPMNVGDAECTVGPNLLAPSDVPIARSLSDLGIPISISVNNSHQLGEHSLFVRSIHKEEFVPSTRVDECFEPDIILARLLLNLSAQYFLPETAQQNIVEKTFAGFQLCRNKFEGALSSLDVPERLKTTVEEVFEESFQQFVGSLHNKYGSLRNTHNRSKFYKANLNLVQPIQTPILDDDGLETGDYVAYVPIHDTSEVMLQDENVRHFVEEPDPPNADDTFFDITDGKAVKSNNPFV
ncbi:hypothetical protein QAD02_013314 [Eretmocerus hayati]|uniref:Uncharacterized protein n=1 Tax=Eretmocerus hayati TaxID=131215 RepID=A0ACC2P2C5_9HYME|nr:hypothetical protein QAD02_013314 [Eretmocerus hayati]